MKFFSSQITYFISNKKSENQYSAACSVSGYPFSDDRSLRRSVSHHHGNGGTKTQLDDRLLLDLGYHEYAGFWRYHLYLRPGAFFFHDCAWLRHRSVTNYVALYLHRVLLCTMDGSPITRESSSPTPRYI